MGRCAFAEPAYEPDFLEYGGHIFAGLDRIETKVASLKHDCPRGTQTILEWWRGCVAAVETST